MGILNALYFLPLLLFNRNRNNLEVVAKNKPLPTLKEFLSIIVTFCITTFAWIFFRAESVGHATAYISQIFSKTFFDNPVYHNDDSTRPIFLLIFIFLIIEWMGREQKYAIERIKILKHRTLRYGFYYALIILIFWFGGEPQEFIYFQF